MEEEIEKVEITDVVAPGSNEVKKYLAGAKSFRTPVAA